MDLLCLGDVALVNNKLTGTEWKFPIATNLGDDVRILFNWELPIGEKVDPSPRSCGGPRLISFPTSPEVIRHWAPGFAALATNHILDAKEQGLADTITSLTRTGFTTTGAGLTQEEITKPLIWETKEGKLAIINWVFAETNPDWMKVPGPNCWQGIEEAKKIIHKLKQDNDWVLVLAHWSDELFPYPRKDDRLIVQELAHSGVDIFIGHHPHVVRGMEVINGCPVFYSLGNFFFSPFAYYPGDNPSKWAPRNREALGVQISFKRGMKPCYQALSFWQEDNQSIKDPRRRAVRRMESTSLPLKRYVGKEYEQWYAAQRHLFDTYWAKWHFGVLRYGFSGLVKRILSKFH